MSSILELLPSTHLGYGGKTPSQFEMGADSTLHYMSSLNGNPPFSSYSDPYLKRQHPTKLSLGTLNPPKYLDNPPK
jgi:hypothetical protein